MGREAYRSLYGDLTKLKDDSVLKDPAAGSDDDDELFQLLLAVSDWVDNFCNRHFYPRWDTLVLDGNGFKRLAVPDLLSVASLTEDAKGDRSFDANWADGDYRLVPYNSSPAKPWGTPYNAIEASGRRTVFKEGDGNLRVEGVWGYRAFYEGSGAAVTGGPVTPDAAAFAVDDGSQLAVGQTVALGSEMLLVTGIIRQPGHRVPGAQRLHRRRARRTLFSGHSALAGGGGAGGFDPNGPNLDQGRRLRALLR